MLFVPKPGAACRSVAGFVPAQGTFAGAGTRASPSSAPPPELRSCATGQALVREPCRCQGQSVQHEFAISAGTRDLQLVVQHLLMLA